MAKLTKGVCFKGREWESRGRAALSELSRIFSFSSAQSLHPFNLQNLAAEDAPCVSNFLKIDATKEKCFSANCGTATGRFNRRKLHSFTPENDSAGVPSRHFFRENLLNNDWKYVWQVYEYMRCGLIIHLVYEGGSRTGYRLINSAQTGFLLPRAGILFMWVFPYSISIIYTASVAGNQTPAVIRRY